LESKNNNSLAVLYQPPKRGSNKSCPGKSILKQIDNINSGRNLNSINNDYKDKNYKK